MLVKKMPNALFLGSIPSVKIPAFLECFDLLFLAYKDTGFIEQFANPHKILEYLGSGNAIISSWISEYQNTQDLVYMVEKNSNYLQKFNDIRNNLGFYNMEKFRKKRREFALKNTYQEKIREIEGLI